jgi:hypothetical protein
MALPVVSLILPVFKDKAVVVAVMPVVVNTIYLFKQAGPI